MKATFGGIIGGETDEGGRAMNLTALFCPMPQGRMKLKRNRRYRYGNAGFNPVFLNRVVLNLFYFSILIPYWSSYFQAG